MKGGSHSRGYEMKTRKKKSGGPTRKTVAVLATFAQAFDKVLTKEQVRQAKKLYRAIEVECNSSVTDPMARAFAIALAGVTAFEHIAELLEVKP